MSQLVGRVDRDAARLLRTCQSPNATADAHQRHVISASMSAVLKKGVNYDFQPPKSAAKQQRNSVLFGGAGTAGA
jgi:hypothetical protein